MLTKHSKTKKETLKKLLSFAVAAINATNVIMPVAIPYIDMTQTLQQSITKQDIQQKNLINFTVETAHLGMQIIDSIVFSKAEAFTTPVKEGEIIKKEEIIGGTQTILSGGTTIDVNLREWGTQTIQSGGLAISTFAENAGRQHIYSGGVASNATFSCGFQYIHEGGLAVSTIIRANQAQSEQNISKGGLAISTIIGAGAWQNIRLGGSALHNNIEESGGQIIASSGLAKDTTVSSGGRQIVYNGGVSKDTVVNSGGIQSIYSGGTALNVSHLAGAQVYSRVHGGDVKTIVSGTNEKGAFSLSNGTASNFVINAEQLVYPGGTALDTTVNSGGIQYVSSGGTSLNVTQNIGGQVMANASMGDSNTIVSGTNEKGNFSLSNGTASNFVINTGKQYIDTNCIAIDTTINAGIQHIYAGGTSLNVIQGEKGNVYVNVRGGDTKTLVTGTNEKGVFSLSNGTASNFIVNASNTVNVGGTAISTTINSGGAQEIVTGGTSLDITQNVGGDVAVTVLGGDTSTFVSGINEKGSFSLENGTGSNFVINKKTQTVSSGGTALQTTINSGGVQYVASGGTSIDITQSIGGIVYVDVYGNDDKTLISGTNEKGTFSLANGTANNFIVGIYPQTIYDGGTALNTTIKSGGLQSVSGGKTVDTTIESAGTQIVWSDGVATNTLIATDAIQQVSIGGTALNTSIGSGGLLYVDAGGTSLNVNQAAGGFIEVPFIDGTNSKTIVTGVNKNGAFSLANGTASNFVLGSNALNVGNVQSVYNGGTAIHTSLEDSSTQYIVDGGTAIHTTLNGSRTFQDVHRGGLAVSTTINGGNQSVFNFNYGGPAIASATIINSDGRQNVQFGGVVIETIVNNGGSQFVHDGGSATDTVVNSGGIVYGQSNGTITAATINSGGSMLLFRGAIVDSVDNSGTIDASKFNNGTISTLAGSGGVVLFNSDPYTPVIYSQVLNLDNLSGTQTFDIAVDLKSNMADNLVIAGDASGTHYIKVTKEASPGSALGGLSGSATVATVLGVDTSEFLGTQSAIDGVKILPNIVHNGNFWQIEGYSVTGVSDLSQVAGGAADLGYAALYNGDGILKARLGDLRESVKDAGVWAKLSGGELAAGNNNLKHASFQGGYDKVRTGASGTGITGIMLEHLDGSTTYTANGSGKLRNTRLGLYHTWFGNSGQYYDLVLKTGSLRNEINVYESELVKGNYSTWNTSLSMEYGYKKQLKNGIYINPLAKLSFGRINGASYTTDSDTLVRQDGINSLLGRIGIGIGQSTERSKWYLNAAILHEFAAKSKVTTGQGAFASAIENSLKGTALELSLGTSVQVSKAGLLYTDISKSFGGKVVNKWQLQAGYRFNF